jgi:hypothetical protein
MSLLDTASLIVTPNGYKEGTLYSVIPSDGSGDMSVVRATTATRVNSAGLVELVPYNLFTYSEQFDNADWSKSSGTITANSTTAPNGTTTAETFTGNGTLNNHDFFQGFTGGSATTSTIYVKKNTAQFVYISLNYQSSGVNWATGIYDLDNLTTATFQSGGVTNQIATISDAGNGWRRITLSVSTADTSLFCMYGLSDSMSPSLSSRGRVENTSSQSFYAWGAQLVEGSTAKDYQKTETRLNIPRLDYSNGTCPSLLVEPQRTNILPYSSSFDNAAWTKGGVTVVANNTTSPSGIQDADKIVSVNGQTSCYVYQLLSTANGNQTLSIYAKPNGCNWIELVIVDAVVSRVWINILTGTVGTTTGAILNATTEDAGNGWYRITATVNNTILAVNSFIVLADGDNIDSFTGNGTSGVYFWGAQLELGSYPTSYIPTTSASVTRNADVVSKTGISSLIGQTEGTLFLDVDFNNIDQTAGVDTLMTLNDGTTANEISILLDTPSGANKTLLGLIRYSNSYDVLIYAPSPITATRYKIALSYKLNDVVLYINGTQIGTDTSATIPSTSVLSLNSRSDNSFLNLQQEYIQATALWKTRLTNTQLAQLTTI